MGLNLSAKGAKSESEIGSGKPAKGRYLAVVKSVNEEMDKDDKIVIDFETLAGTTPDQRGKILTEYFATSEKAIPRLTRLAMCTSLLKPDEVKDVSFMPAIGRYLFIEVEDHGYKDKNGKDVETVRVSFSGMWSIGNPDVADLLQVPEIAAMINVLRGQQTQAPSTPAPTTAPANDANKWGSLLK